MPAPPLPARGPADIPLSVTAAAKAAYVTTARSADAQTEAATDTDAVKKLATAAPTALDFADKPTSLQPGGVIFCKDLDTNTKHNLDMPKQTLDDQTAPDNKDLDEKTNKVLDDRRVNAEIALPAPGKITENRACTPRRRVTTSSIKIG